MKHLKVWAVLGEDAGLGLAAVKYLISKDQIVIALSEGASPHPFFEEPLANLFLIDISKVGMPAVNNILQSIGAQYGAIDFIINNGNYNIFRDAQTMTVKEVQWAITKEIDRSIEMIQILLPYLSRDPKGRLINVPPQLCLVSVADRKVADNLGAAMELFLGALQIKLQALDCTLIFLKPNDRLTDLSI
jgi:short-subunit dehydrogenase involved in D-alanine esterification of teichoic acids